MTLSMPNVDFAGYFDAIDAKETVMKPTDFEDKILTLSRGKRDGVHSGITPLLRFRTGEVTIWAARNGHGKSLLTGQVAMRMMMKGIKVLIMSLEMSPERTVYRMLRQAFGHRPEEKDEDAILDALDEMDQTLRIFNVVGTLNPKTVLGCILYAGKEMGITQIFIDNLMRVVPGEDDYNAQKDFIVKLSDVAKRAGVHVHLVHHARKSGRETDDIDKDSLKGTGTLADNADNIVLLIRNLQKELADASEKGYGGKFDDEKVPDTVVRVAKQRNGDWEGKIGLWYSPYATSFCETFERRCPQLINCIVPTNPLMR